MGFQMTQMLHIKNTFYNQIVLKQSSFALYLKYIILLDNQSTMDLFCNIDLVNKISKSSSKMQLQSNGGTMTVNRKATLPGYKKRVWYNTNAITNILSLQNLIDQYWVTYNSIDRMFVVHQEPEGKANMQFKIHSCGLHYFDPQDSSFIFVNTVQENKEDYSNANPKVMDDMIDWLRQEYKSIFEDGSGKMTVS